MPIMVEKEKWILYKHTSNYGLIKEVAYVVKNSCLSKISNSDRHRMQDILKELNLYKTRNPVEKPLDSINHRINTLAYYMFGYEDKENKLFIFSPLGNLFLKHINNEEKLRKIFIAMLFAVQFKHPANSTPKIFQIYPFRLLLKLMREPKLGYKLYSTEYAYLIAFVKSISKENYSDLLKKILDFRALSDDEKFKKLKEDEHTYVNCIYEWQYYTQQLLKDIGILTVFEGEEIGKLYHPCKPTSKSKPTGRSVKNGYSSVSKSECSFIDKMLMEYSPFAKPLKLDDKERLQLDIIKEIYSFYPQLLLTEIGEKDDLQVKLLELPKRIEEYSNNPDNKTAYLFEDVLAEGFNMFVNVEAKKIGGAGHTDIECLYLTKKRKFAVEAKSTANKLLGINAGRLREQRYEIGGDYTIVITPRYVPAAKNDIQGTPIVIILASTFSEYLYNHIYHNVRDIDYEDFDKIITKNLGKDISKLISNVTMSKFAISKVS